MAQFALPQKSLARAARANKNGRESRAPVLIIKDTGI